MLPVPLRHHVAYGRPDVLPLLWAMDEYQPYAILAVTRERARLLGGTCTIDRERGRLRRGLANPAFLRSCPFHGGKLIPVVDYRIKPL